MRLPLPLPDGLSMRSTADLAVAEPAWRALEGVGVGSPYQRFDWVRSWRAAQAGVDPYAFAVWIVADSEGAPVLVLPVEIATRGPVRIAQAPGGRHANFAMPLVSRSLARSLAPREASAVVAQLAEASGVDVVMLANQPMEVDGVPNPFASLPAARPAPEPASMLDLAARGEGAAERLLSKETRKKFGKKRRALGQRGNVRSGRARDAAEADAILQAFLRLKALRCAEKGLANPFAAPEAVLMLEGLVAASADVPDPVFELHALWCGERVVAVFGAVRRGSWLSGSVLAHDSDPELARYSPGELLLLDVVDGAAARGIARFDLGVGATPYKARFCPDPLPLVDLVQPVTLLGQAAAPLIAGAGRMKAAIKRDPRLMGVVRSLEPLFGARR